MNGSDAFSRSLRGLVTDGNIKAHHLEVCTNCAGLAHNALYCVFSNSATEKQYWAIMRLRSIYLHAMKVTNSNGPAFNGSKKRDLSSLAFDHSDTLVKKVALNPVAVSVGSLAHC